MAFLTNQMLESKPRRRPSSALNKLNMPLQARGRVVNRGKKDPMTVTAMKPAKLEKIKPVNKGMMRGRTTPVKKINEVPLRRKSNLNAY